MVGSNTAESLHQCRTFNRTGTSQGRPAKAYNFTRAEILPECRSIHCGLRTLSDALTSGRTARSRLSRRCQVSGDHDLPKGFKLPAVNTPSRSPHPWASPPGAHAKFGLSFLCALNKSLLCFCALVHELAHFVIVVVIPQIIEARGYCGFMLG